MSNELEYACIGRLEERELVLDCRAPAETTLGSPFLVALRTPVL